MMILTLPQSSSLLRSVSLFYASENFLCVFIPVCSGTEPWRALSRQRPAVRVGDGDCSSGHALHQPLLHADAAETEPRRGAAGSGGNEQRFGSEKILI